MIQQRRDRGGMDIRDVVHLGIRFHRNLPVTVEIKAVSRRQATLIKLKLLPFMGDRSEPIEQANGLSIKINKDELTESFAANAR